MTVGSWNPDVQVNTEHSALTPETLVRLLEIEGQYGLENLADALGDDEAQALSTTITLDQEVWLVAAESQSDESLLALIRFFAVAENLPGWEAMEKSPVIPLARTLRKRGARLDKTFLQWLRSVSSNRYLPYGPL
ncbi:MAG: hypothetical protein ACJAZ0_000442 [Halioglobus sp.]|jgi:hypothetical protein